MTIFSWSGSAFLLLVSSQTAADDRENVMQCTPSAYEATSLGDHANRITCHSPSSNTGSEATCEPFSIKMDRFQRTSGQYVYEWDDEGGRMRLAVNQNTKDFVEILSKPTSEETRRGICKIIH